MNQGWKNDKSGEKRLPFKCVETKPLAPSSREKPLGGAACSIEVTFFDFELQASIPFDSHQPYLVSTRQCSPVRGAAVEQSA